MIESAARRLATELVNRRESINRELSRNGVRFGIYKDGEYHDRLFPYDPIPRIIESNEFDEMEAGLKQRVNALNAYLRDVYSDKKVIKDGIIPEEYVYTSAGYFPQVNGVTPPGGVFAHIAGEDLVQGQDGKWWVLEDNLRIPSGASYPLFARDIERRITPSLFRDVHVRDNRDYPRLLRKSMDFVSTEGIAVVLTPGRYNSAFFEHAYLAEKPVPRWRFRKISKLLTTRCISLIMRANAIVWAWSTVACRTNISIRSHSIRIPSSAYRAFFPHIVPAMWRSSMHRVMVPLTTRRSTISCPP